MTPTIAEGREQVNLFRLLTIRSGLKLEQKGFRLTSKAPKCSAIVKAEYGLKRNATLEQCLQVIEQAIACAERGEPTIGLVPEQKVA